MNRSRLYVEVVTHKTNLNFTTQLALDGDKWSVVVGNNKIRAVSTREYDVPVSGQSDAAKDQKIEYILNKAVGHLRNIFYFSFDLTMQWGYVGGYNGVQLQNNDGFFPSIHNNGTSTTSVTYDQKHIVDNQKVLDDIKNSRARSLKTMLNYWRRAKELDDLGFDSEAFLNYFKVIECLAQLDKNDGTATDIKLRFSSQKTLQKRYKFRTHKQLSGDIAFTARALATANLDARIKRGLVEKMLDIMYIRHGWNIAHKLLRPNPYDTYDAMGQHSDEFRLVMIENSNIETVTKFLILNYIKPGKYPLGPIFFVKKH